MMLLDFLLAGLVIGGIYALIPSASTSSTASRAS